MTLTFLGTRVGGRSLCAAAALALLVFGARAAETGRPTNDGLGPGPLGGEAGGRVVPSTYVLGPDDEISIRVMESEEISEEPFRIDPGGDISLPMLGRVRAAGRTPRELETKLAERLRAFIHEPQALVRVTQFRSQPVSVIGAVNKPGIHQLEGRKSLIEILSLAGGLRQDAGHTVKITRRREWGAIPLENAADDPSGRFQIAEVSLEAVMEARNPEENVLIMPNDVISVPRAEMIYVIGGVQRAGGFVLHEKESITVLQALALAGGLTRTAAKKNAKILRPTQDDRERVEIIINLKDIMAGRSEDVVLERDDILFVPHSGGKRAAQRGVEAGIAMLTGVVIWGVGR